MIVLAIDCALGPGQVVLADGGRELARCSNDNATDAAESLIGLVDEVLAHVGLLPDRIDRIAVTTGPGRFTSIRTAIATARGLSMAWGCPLVGITTFDLIAAAIKSDDERTLGVLIPVGRGELACRLYRSGKVFGDVHVGTAAALLARINVADCILAGPGAVSFGPEAAIVPLTLDAFELAQVAMLRPVEGQVMPVYARPPDADLPSDQNMGLSFVIDFNDEPALLAAQTLHAQCFAQPWSASALQQLVAEPNTRLVVIGKRASPVAMGIVRHVVDEAEILTICVVPAARGAGFGRKVMDYMISIAQRNGAGQVFLEVAEDNIEALGLYKSLDFQKVGRRSNYYANNDGPGKTALILRREISKVSEF